MHRHQPVDPEWLLFSNADNCPLQEIRRMQITRHSPFPLNILKHPLVGDTYATGICKNIEILQQRSCIRRHVKQACLVRRRLLGILDQLGLGELRCLVPDGHGLLGNYLQLH